MTVSKILNGVLIISLMCNVILGFYLIKGGINITNHTENKQYQQQFQGQLQFNMWMAQGNKIKWNKIVTNSDEVVQKLEQLPPQYSYFAKLMYTSNTIAKVNVIIYYPEFMTMTEKEIK